MRGLGWLLGLVIVALAVALLAPLNQSFAVLVWYPWELRLSGNALLLGFLLVSLLGYALARVLVGLFNLPDAARAWRAEKKLRAARNEMVTALTAMLEGRYQKAERAARAQLAVESQPSARLGAQLMAARAAHAMRDFEKRDHYLDAAREEHGPHTLALAMTEAELLSAQHRHQDALAALAIAREISPKLTQALRMELRLRQQLNQPEPSLKLVEELARSEAITPHQARQIRISALCSQLKQDFTEARPLRLWWNKLPMEDREQRRLAEHCAQRFAELGEGKQAAQVLLDALKAEWHPELVELFGRIRELGGQDISAVDQLSQAESWLKQHPKTPELLLTLARLCRQQQLWGKARNYYEASLGLRAGIRSHAELADLLTELGDSAAASKHYQQSLQLALHSPNHPG